MGIGVGIVLIIILISLAIAWQSKEHKLGQAIFYIFIGLLLASLAPGLPQAANDFINQTSTSVQHIDPKK